MKRIAVILISLVVTLGGLHAAEYVVAPVSEEGAASMVLASDWYDGLVLWMPFSGGEDSVTNDLSRLASTGTAAAGIAWADGCMTLHGTNYVTFTDDAARDSTNWSLCAWIKSAAVENGYILADGVPSVNNSINLFRGASIVATYTNQIVVANSGTNYTSSAVITNDGTWAHVAVSAAGCAVAFYYNGLPAGTNMLFAPVTSTTSNLYVGARVGSTVSNAMFQGCLDDVRLYLRTLSASDWAEVYDKTRTAHP